MKLKLKSKPKRWSDAAWKSFCEAQVEKWASAKNWPMMQAWKKKLRELAQPRLFEVEYD